MDHGLCCRRLSGREVEVKGFGQGCNTIGYPRFQPSQIGLQSSVCQKKRCSSNSNLRGSRGLFTKITERRNPSQAAKMSSPNLAEMVMVTHVVLKMWVDSHTFTAQVIVMVLALMCMYGWCGVNLSCATFLLGLQHSLEHENIHRLCKI